MLPQNLLINPGTLYEDFETIGDWSATAGSIATNITEYKTGTHSVKGTSASGGSSVFSKTVDTSFADFGRVSFWAYLHSTLADYNSSVMIRLSETTNYSKYWRAWVVVAGYLDLGWNLLSFPQGFFTAGAGSPNWSNNIVRLRFFQDAKSAKITDVSYDTLTTGIRAIPAVMLTFDDGYTSHYTKCFKYMKRLGIRGTEYINSSYIGTYLSVAQLQEMDRNGWIIGNHTNQGAALDSLTEAQQETAINGCITDLTNIGLTRGVKYLALVAGTFNDDTVTAMTNLGILTARTVNPFTVRPQVLPYSNLRRLVTYGVSSSDSLATLTGYVDTIITQKSILPLHFHDVGGSGQITEVNFNSLMDYIYTKWKAGLIYPITIDDFYKLSLGPVKVPR